MNYLTEKAKQLTPYVAGIQPRETGWIKLNTNENPYPPSPKVADALAKAGTNALRLYPDSDSNILRDTIANRLSISAENIFCANGSDEVLALAYQAFFSGKENILTPDISYAFYPVWSQMYDVSTTLLPLDDNFVINIDQYKNGNGVIIANPNAPTGLALTLRQIEQIVQNNPNGVVLIDEAYIDFAGAEIESAVPLVAKYDNLLVVQTMSKSYSLAGLRVGFGVGSKAIIDGLQRLKNAFNPYPLGWLEQNAAVAAFRDIEYWDATRQKVIATRDKTIHDLRELGYRVEDSHTNFLFIQSSNAKALYEHLLKNKILARYWEKPRLSEYLRISIGTDREMEALVQWIKQL